MSRIYVASKTRHADKWKWLRADGVPIVSTWIDEAGPGESADLSDLWLRCVAESSSATVLIAYMEPVDILKGAFIEIGCALAFGHPVYAVGFPDSMSFLSHPLVKQFDSLAFAVEAAEQFAFPAPEARTEDGEVKL